MMMITIVMIIITYLSVSVKETNHQHLADDHFTSFAGKTFEILPVSIDLAVRTIWLF